MPAISMFYGIVIYLYFFDDERYGMPHIVQAWIEIHREALIADWELAVQGQPPFSIEPLR